MKTINEIMELLSKQKFSVTNEKETQIEVEKCLMDAEVKYEREFYLDKDNIPDFYIQGAGVLIEVKLKANARKIYRQLNRYVESAENDPMYGIKDIILLTSNTVHMPNKINDINIHIVNFGAAWLS